MRRFLLGKIMTSTTQTMVGVGLRHEHYFDALDDVADIDFVEVHAENYFSTGGAPKYLLQQARRHYDVSIHGTSLGLGSVLPPSPSVLKKFSELCDLIDPILVSDHACFNRAVVHGKALHTGDLLPLRFNYESLGILARHVDLVQNTLQRTLLLENLSAYIPNQAQELAEFEFLAKLCEQTGCKLLLDVNNLLVNAHNANAMAEKQSNGKPIEEIMQAISPISSTMIGEYHLAGTTPKASNQIMIDDHARPVSDLCWEMYEVIITQYGVKPTLIEWDQDLPTWRELVSLASKAKHIQTNLINKSTI